MRIRFRGEALPMSGETRDSVRTRDGSPRQTTTQYGTSHRGTSSAGFVDGTYDARATVEVSPALQRARDEAARTEAARFCDLRAQRDAQCAVLVGMNKKHREFWNRQTAENAAKPLAEPRKF